MLLAAAPQLLDSPCCAVINRVPWGLFMVVHVAVFALAVVFASQMFGNGRELFGLGFAFVALAELSYMTYHVNLTLFLFAHTISEVLVLAGIGTLFTAIAREGLLTAIGDQHKPARKRAVRRKVGAR
jgi:hypothetical protein